MKTFFLEKREMLQRAAGRLFQKTSRLPRLTVLLAVLGICILLSCIDLVILARAFRPRAPDHSSDSQIPIPGLPKLPRKNEGNARGRPMIPNSLVREIESLKANDSLMNARPHLLDSIQKIEDYFNVTPKR
jgi:hypothetical protein